MNAAARPTPEPVDSPQRPRRGIWGCLLLFGALAGVLLVSLMVLYAFQAIAAAGRVDAQLAELRDRGEPTTVDELAAYYSFPPSGEDVTPLLLRALAEVSSPSYQRASADLPIVGAAEYQIPPPGQSWEDLSAAEQLLEEFGGALQLLHEAADKGGAARFSIDFEQGFNVMLEHTAHIRAAARLLALEAHVKAHQGDSEGVTRSIISTLSLARSLENEPVVVSQLVSNACEGYALRQVDQLLPHVDFSDQQLMTLQDQLRRGRIAASLRRALVGERAMGIEVMRNTNEMVLDETTSAIPPALIGRNEDLALYLETMGRYIAATDQPWPLARKQADAAERDFMDTALASALSRLRYVMSGMLLPAVGAMMTAGARTEATRRVVDTAIAAKRYRLQHGRWPQDLQAMVPEYLPAVPEDPFDGQPLRYRVEDDDVIVYSVGKDQVDDGGQGSLEGEPDLAMHLKID